MDDCLQCLDDCNVYLLIVGVEYGTTVGDLSITHAEYRRAREAKLPILTFIKGDRRAKREEGTARLLAELDTDGLKYKRFGNVIELQKEIRAALVKLLQKQYGITPTSDDDQIAEQTIEATSPFESGKLDQVRGSDLDLTLARNPVLAQCLSYFHRIEERGSGFRRMRDQMLDHGLDLPLLGTEMGYFQVTFPGPADNIERLRVPAKRRLVTEAVEARLNERQRQIMQHVLESGAVTRRWCVAQFQIANDTAGRDLKGLTDLGLLRAEGRGRAVRYVIDMRRESTDNRPS